MNARQSMQHVEADKNSSTTVMAALGQRFALKKLDIVILLAVGLFIGGWVRMRDWFIVRGNVSSEELLGRPLRVGIVTWPGYAGGLTANNGLRATKDSDFWNHDRKLLVDFELIEDEKELIDKLVAGGEHGGVDVIWSTVDSLARQYPEFQKRGVSPRAFLQVDWSRGADAIVANAEIRRPEELKGKSIAVSMAASQWLLEYSLESSNLVEPGAASLPVTIHRTGGSQEALQLFKARKVEAAVLWEPYVTEAKGNGRRVLVDTRMAGNLIADVMVAREEFIREHHDVIFAFIEGWLFDGTPKAQIDPMLASHVLQDEPVFRELGEDETRKVLEKVSLATFQDNVRMFGLSDDGAIFDQLFNRASALWVKRGYIPITVPAEQARDSSLLKELYSAHGSPVAKTGCGRLLFTKEIAMTFTPGSAQLGPDARRGLDDEDLGFLIRALSGVRFCVQVSGDVNSIPLPPEVSQARANSVIDYLALHYLRPRDDFAPAVSTTMSDDDQSTPSILLKITGPKENTIGEGPIPSQQRNHAKR